jgi:PEP-CTERM motif
MWTYRVTIRGFFFHFILGGNMGLTGHFVCVCGAVGDRQAEFFQQRNMTLRGLRTAVAVVAILAAGTFTARATDIPIYNNLFAGNPPSLPMIGNATLETNGRYYTTMVADDITLGAGFAGSEVTGFAYSVVNYNSDPETDIGILISVFADDNGAPGALLYSTPFSGDVPGGFYSFPEYDPGTPLFIAQQKMWIGESFTTAGTDDPSTPAEQAVVNNFGIVLHDGPTVGSSSDNLFVTSAPSTGPLGSPAGNIFTNSPGSIAFELFTNVAPAPVPEPSSLSLLVLGLGTVGGLVRRKLHG